MTLANFTPQEIEQFLQEFFDVVGTRQYIGARYVPIFGRRGETSIDWDNSAPYEPLTIVTYQGDSYTSRQYVPTGVSIDNLEYWVKTGDYNAQVEQYRTEVVQLQADWAEWKADTESDIEQWEQETAEELIEEIGNLPAIIPASAFSASHTIKDYVDDPDIVVCFGDSWGASAAGQQDNSWPYWLSKAMGWELHNYCISGAGVISNSIASLSDELGNAIADTSYEKKRVKHVYVVMGCNDYKRYENDASITGVFSSGFNDLCHRTFPNADFHFIQNGWPIAPEHQATYETTGLISMVNCVAYTRCLRWICATYGWDFKNLSQILRFSNSTMNTYYHPNQYGSRMFASCIIEDKSIFPYDVATIPFIWDDSSLPETISITGSANNFTARDGCETSVSLNGARITATSSSIDLKPYVNALPGPLQMALYNMSTGDLYGFLFSQGTGYLNLRVVPAFLNIETQVIAVSPATLYGVNY